MLMETERNPKSFQKREFLNILLLQRARLKGAMPNKFVTNFFIKYSQVSSKEL